MHMETVVTEHIEINKLLCDVDSAATENINNGLKTYVIATTVKPSSPMTQKQRGALHVWCEQFAKALNDAGYPRKIVRINGDIAETDWKMITFKEDVYKVMLKALTQKGSTEEQDTVDPSEVANHINRHMGQTRGVTVAWPSNR